jgi:hypothetical protein
VVWLRDSRLETNNPKGLSLYLRNGAKVTITNIQLVGPVSVFSDSVLRGQWVERRHNTTHCVIDGAKIRRRCFCRVRPVDDPEVCSACCLPVDGDDIVVRKLLDTCYMCCSRDADVVFIPCGHVCICSVCRDEYLDRGFGCICTAKVLDCIHCTDLLK